MENEFNLTDEQLEQIAKAPSAAALFALAQENNISLTAEEAALYYTQLHPEASALSDEELDSVSGSECRKTFDEHCPKCGGTHTKMYLGGLHCYDCDGANPWHK